MNATVTEEVVRDALASVMDPEIPACSIVDLGMVHDVRVTGDAIEVDLLPTFVGCPATDMIRRDVVRALRGVAPDAAPKVTFVWDPPWTTDRITASGRDALRGFGIAPAPAARSTGTTLLQIQVPCPYCGSLDTVVESDFGPTPCRTIRYCRACNNPFEGFKRKEL